MLKEQRMTMVTEGPQQKMGSPLDRVCANGKQHLQAEASFYGHRDGRLTTSG